MVIYKQTVIGFDNSNSSFKTVSQDTVINYTNTLTELTESNTSKLLESKQDVFTYNGKRYIVGLKNSFGSGSKDESRYYSEQYKTETVVGLSQCVKFDNEILKVIAGVPANLAERNDLIEKMKANLLGTYEVYQNEARKCFTIADVNVVSQPVGTLYSVLYDTNGNPKLSLNGTFDKMASKKNYLIIDVGFGTTDLVELLGGKLGNNRTLPKAMSDYVSRLYTEIEKEFPESRLSAAVENPYELDLMLVESDILGLPRGTFNVRNIKNKCKNELATIIKSALDKYGYNFELYHYIVLTGGGSKTLEDSLRRIFHDDTRIQITEDPIMANCRGYYIIGRKHYKI